MCREYCPPTHQPREKQIGFCGVGNPCLKQILQLTFETTSELRDNDSVSSPWFNFNELHLKASLSVICVMVSIILKNVSGSLGGNDKIE